MEFNVINTFANQNTRDYVEKQVNGRQMKALALKRITEIQRMKALGLAKPATILNFNPVALRLESGIPWKVPSIVDPAVNDNLKLTFEYKKKQYKAVLQTLEQPHFYPWITDVFKEPDRGLEDGVGVYDIKCCKQIEMAYHFWQDYTSPSPINGIRMGGVICFQGDKHALRGDTLEVPVYVALPNYEREYITEPRKFSDLLATCLDIQRDHYDLNMLTASGYWNDPDQRKNITNIHLVWAQFGLDMGYRETPVDWHISVDEPQDTCDGCGATKKRALAYFCHACARPYDPFQAYMDKELAFDNGQMNRIADDQWPLVLVEENRRRARRGLPPLPMFDGQAPEVKNPQTPKSHKKKDDDGGEPTQ